MRVLCSAGIAPHLDVLGYVQLFKSYLIISWSANFIDMEMYGMRQTQLLVRSAQPFYYFPWSHPEIWHWVICVMAIPLSVPFICLIATWIDYFHGISARRPEKRRHVSSNLILLPGFQIIQYHPVVAHEYENPLAKYWHSVELSAGLPRIQRSHRCFICFGEPKLGIFISNFPSGGYGAPSPAPSHPCGRAQTHSYILWPQYSGAGWSSTHHV